MSPERLIVLIILIVLLIWVVERTGVL